MAKTCAIITAMSDDGFAEQPKDGETRGAGPGATQPARPLEGPGSEERLRALQAKIRARNPSDRMSTLQLVLIGVFIFLVILVFGSGRFVIADLAPKPPPGVDLNTPVLPGR